jgi:2-(1,2-epoxy-1,2-dihydrophenyl)acetyl-CoA isomerase
MSEEVVLVERNEATVVVTINRPQALNALTPETNTALKRAIDDAAREKDVAAVVLTGAGRAFCAGADLKGVAARLDAGDASVGDDLRRNYAPLTRAIRECPKPVIAALNGTAAGAGLSLALACDLRVAAAGSQLIVAFVRVGLVPDAGCLFFLTRMLGLSKATELAMTGDPLAVEDAMRLGLIAAVVPADQVLPTALAHARALAQLPSQTLALIKRGIERSLVLDLEQTLELEAALQTLAGRSADAREAIRAFVEKRQPVFGKSEK